MTNPNDLEKVLKDLNWSKKEIKDRVKNSKRYKPGELTTALLSQQIRQFNLLKSTKTTTFKSTLSNELTYDALRSLQLDEEHWEFAFKMLHRILPWHRTSIKQYRI